MAVARKRKLRNKPLDLQRRASSLNVSLGHLSRVLSGERESRNLLRRYEQLVAGESNSTQKQNE